MNKKKKNMRGLPMFWKNFLWASWSTMVREAPQPTSIWQVSMSNSSSSSGMRVFVCLVLGFFLRVVAFVVALRLSTSVSYSLFLCWYSAYAWPCSSLRWDIRPPTLWKICLMVALHTTGWPFSYLLPLTIQIQIAVENWVSHFCWKK